MPRMEHASANEFAKGGFTKYDGKNEKRGERNWAFIRGWEVDSLGGEGIRVRSDGI